MKKIMFSKFTSILQHAVGALAPQLSLQEEFVYHWKAVTTYFIENKGEKLPVEQTSIPAHLEQMLVILQREELEAERGMYGPCLEYLLQHKLLETLYSLSRTDYPPGMKQIVLSFFTKLLSRIKQPLLAHVNVYRAVQRLIKTCGEVKAAPTEIEEIQFLCTVCAKIKGDPYLVNFFLEMPKRKPSAMSTGIAETPTPVMEEPTSENKLFQEFYLVSTLLNLTHSEDSRVAVKACEGLILCASLPEPIAAHCLINSTKFCEDFTSRLIDTYRNLPEMINPLDLEHVQAKWGMEVITEKEDQQTFVGMRHLISFLSWLDYCDQLSDIANPIVSEALSRSIHERFLIPHFKPALLQMSESGAITATAYLNRCLRTVCSQRLLSEFVLFILGNERKTELRGVMPDTLRYRLIDRCNNISEEVCLITLQLFDTLLQKDDELILHNLLIRNLEERSYYESKQDPKSAEKTNESIDCPKDLNTSEKESSNLESSENTRQISLNDSGVEISNSPGGIVESLNKAESQNEAESLICEVDKSLSFSIEEHKSEQSELSELGMCNKEVNVEKVQVKSKHEDDKNSIKEDTAISVPSSKTEVHKIVNSFLSLLPEELKSSYQTADSGYDMYLRDANRQYAAMIESCKSRGYPKDVSCVPTGNEEFYEGSFLHMIMDKQSHTLDQSYPINLQLTSVISTLALVPNPYLHEYLLDPFLSVKPGVRNLYSVFEKVSKEIRAQFEAEPDLSQKLVSVRKQLMGNTTTIQSLRHDLSEFPAWMEGQGRLEAIIVLEEFCKELSAIAFVKHHTAVTGERQ